MTFLSVLFALAWDQIAPLFRPNQTDRLFERYATWVYAHVNAGTRMHGVLAWSATVLAPALVIGMVGHWLLQLGWLFGLAWSAAVLYQCLGYRQVIDRARALGEALANENAPKAAEMLAELGIEPETAQNEVVARAIDTLFRLALERLFGVMFWFILFGVFGAVVYELSQRLAKRWQGSDDFHTAIRQVAPILDWLPSRLLAFSFAIVGDFEAVMSAWRTRVDPADPFNEGVVRAAGLGALGIDQTMPAGPNFIAGAASLLNRAALLWLGVLGLLWLGGFGTSV
jgi:adenosylcobinamide-phosphate synthase